MRLCLTLALAVGICLFAGSASEVQAAKSTIGNEWIWASGWPQLKNSYGQAIITVGVKYVVTPADTWAPEKVDYVVWTWANGDGTGFDNKYPFSFDTNFSSEHTTTPITVGNGARFFNVRGNTCRFIRMAQIDDVNLEDSAGYVQFRD